MDTHKTVVSLLVALVALVAGVMAAQQDYDRVHTTSTAEVSTGAHVDIFNSSHQIPLAMLRKMSKMDDKEFMKSDMVITDPDSKAEKELELSRSSGTIYERSASAEVAVSAGCNVSLAVVSLVDLLPTNDPLVHYAPKCTRLLRCSGCCSSSLLECQPTSSEKRLLNVRRSVYDPETDQFTRPELVPVVVDEHKECDCLCRIKKTDCNHLQEYDEQECACNCTNDSERSRCLDSPLKFWDTQTCKCSCRSQESHCSAGTIFDVKKCQCVQTEKNKPWYYWLW